MAAQGEVAVRTFTDAVVMIERLWAEIQTRHDVTGLDRASEQRVA